MSTLSSTSCKTNPKFRRPSQTQCECKSDGFNADGFIVSIVPTFQFEPTEETSGTVIQNWVTSTRGYNNVPFNVGSDGIFVVPPGGSGKWTYDVMNGVIIDVFVIPILNDTVTTDFLTAKLSGDIILNEGDNVYIWYQANDLNTLVSLSSSVIYASRWSMHKLQGPSPSDGI